MGRKLCLCALTQGEEPDEWQLVSSVFIHEGIASWIMRPLFQACSHHLLHCLEWPKLMPELEPDFAPWHSSSSGKQDASLAGTIQEQVKSFISSGKDTEHPFLQNEIDQLAANFQNPPSILCNAGRGALTAEFPFSESTQMLKVETKYHEKLGKGVQLLLCLPMGLSPNETGKLALSLNILDQNAIYPSHFLGSWCIDETHGTTLAFSQFIPWAYLNPNLLINYVNGIVGRAQWVDGTLNDCDWAETFEQVQKNMAARYDAASKYLIEGVGGDRERQAEVLDKMGRDNDAADPVFRKLLDFLGILEEPMEVSADFFESVGQFSFFHYGIFNPMGPTWNIFSIARHPKHESLLFCNRMLNPFEQTNHVLGACLEENPDDSYGMVLELFRRNGSTEAPLLGGMPTWVFVPEDASSELAEEAFRSYYEEHGDEGLAKQVANFRKFAGNPWDRASEEMKGAMQEVMAGMKKESFVKKLFKSKATFEDWWNIVSDEEHLQSEVSSMIPAWKGSIDMQNQHGNANSFPHLLNFEGLVKALAECGSADEILARFIKKDAGS